MTQERYTITLRAEPGRWRTSPIIRLRHALKALLRGYGLRAVECKPVVNIEQKEHKST